MPAAHLLPVFGRPMAYAPAILVVSAGKAAKSPPMDGTTTGPRIGMDEPYVSEVDKLFVHRWTSRAWT